MNIHEFEAKEILSQYGVPVPRFRVIKSVDEVEGAFDELGLSKAFLKIQVHAGGRGKAGGVKCANNLEEAKLHASTLLGMKMVNNQTGPDGVVAHQVMVTEPSDVEKEYYLGATIDRESGRATLIGSPEGGMEIEEIAESHPDAILKMPISLDGTLSDKDLSLFAAFMGWADEQAEEGKKLIAAVAKLFTVKDCSLFEINPLTTDKEGKIWALDAKLAVDDNALFRQKEIAQMYDPTQDSPKEVEAKEFGLEYIALDGNIGCMVNGAGLAMATMDIIDHFGGRPANFLDVGGSASREKVVAALKIILSDAKVKAIFINIFGGIMSCRTIAEGVVAAAKDVGVNVPLVVRLEGTHVDEGRAILEKSGLAIISAESLSDGAQKAVKAIGKG